jgi:uncharacterized Zn finger protein
MGYYYGYKPYVPVAKRRAQAAREVSKRIKKGEHVLPVTISGRGIASTFWGKAWCTNLESYGDFSNRLPRGRTYVRNGSVVHLNISKGRIDALVSGSELYEVRIEIQSLSTRDWSALKEQSAGKFGTLIELLQGKLSSAVMELVADRDQGLFPKPSEIKMRCSCPDYAGMCKHVAAVMYGVGHRLDSSPELLFVLRGVDHLELIEQAIPTAPAKTKSSAATIAADDLGAIFDIEIGTPAEAPPVEKGRSAISRARKTVNSPRVESPEPGKTPAVVAASAKKRTKTAEARKTAVLVAAPAEKGTKGVADKVQEKVASTGPTAGRSKRARAGKAT